LLLSLINYRGVGKAAVTQNIFTVLKLAAIAAVIVAGLFLAFDVPPTGMGASLAPPRGAELPLVIGTALVPILFAYGGWQQTNFIAEEIVDAERTLPRALLIGTGIVIAVYVLANLAYLRVLGVTGLANSSAPAADVMGATLGPWGRRIISLGIA